MDGSIKMTIRLIRTKKFLATTSIELGVGLFGSQAFAIPNQNLVTNGSFERGTIRGVTRSRVARTWRISPREPASVSLAILGSAGLLSGRVRTNK